MYTFIAYFLKKVKAIVTKIEAAKLKRKILDRLNQGRERRIKAEVLESYYEILKKPIDKRLGFEIQFIKKIRQALKEPQFKLRG